MKGESNHWFRAVHARGRFEIVPWSGELIGKRLDDIDQHLCSESCASKAMSRAIGANTPRGKEGVE
jgi:hypothetical protein